MTGRLILNVWVVAACLPIGAMAQQPAPNRAASWEFVLGGGVTSLDGALRDFLGSGAPEYRFASSSTPGSGAATVVGSVGYNISRHVGFSLGGAVAKGSGLTFLTPSAAITVTGNLNAKTSPFLVVGTGFTRVSGANDRVTHSVWGLYTGVGIRHAIARDLAVRLDGALRIEGYDEVPMAKSTVVNPVLTIGLSYLVGGRSP